MRDNNFNCLLQFQNALSEIQNTRLFERRSSILIHFCFVLIQIKFCDSSGFKTIFQWQQRRDSARHTTACGHRSVRTLTLTEIVLTDMTFTICHLLNYIYVLKISQHSHGFLRIVRFSGTYYQRTCLPSQGDPGSL